MAKVRYQLANQDEGFVIVRTAHAANQTLHRLLERQKALGYRVRRRTRRDGETEYLVTSAAEGIVARYWLDECATAVAQSLDARVNGH